MVQPKKMGRVHTMWVCWHEEQSTILYLLVAPWSQVRTRPNSFVSANISGENTYQVWSKSRQPFLKYIPLKNHLFSLFFPFLFSFCTLAKKAAVTCKCVIGLPSNLSLIERDTRCILVPNYFGLDTGKIGRIINDFKWKMTPICFRTYRENCLS